MTREGRKRETRFTWMLRIETRHHVGSSLADQLGGLDVDNLDDGTSILCGELPDMPAVYGLILRLRDLAVEVLALEVERVAKDSPRLRDHRGRRKEDW